jgi:hypothetical protein
MSDTQFVQARLLAGTWEARVIGTDGPPRLAVTYLGQPLDTVAVTPEGDGAWRVRVAVPPAAISDGVQTFLVTDADRGDILTSFNLVAGEPLAEDLRAEIALLRAELEMLKQAFRRHAAQG